jgi:uncharacterized protein (TIGR03086 family)
MPPILYRWYMAYDWLDLQIRAHEEFGRRLLAVTDWHAETPDTEWDVSDLARHVIREQQWVPLLLSGKSIEEVGDDIDAIDDDDLLGEWQRWSRVATVAWESAPFDMTVQLSYDTVKMIDYLMEQTADVTIHAWDMARATHSEEELDAELVEATWTIFEPQRETLAATGLYEDPVSIDPDAPLQWRLLAITGRDPR